MDVKREGIGRKKLIQRIVWITLIVVSVPLITWGLSRLKPAAPAVEMSTLWPDTVKRGPMVRQVRGLGTLVPEEILFIPAQTDGRIDKVALRAGVAVKPDTVLLVLSNPELELQKVEAEWQVKAAVANMEDLRVRLQQQKLEQQSRSAQVQADQVKAQLTYERDAQLFKNGLTPDLSVRLSEASASELKHRSAVEKDRLGFYDAMIGAQLEAQRVGIEKLRAAYDLKKRQVDQLTVRAGTDGVLQELTLQVGQRVTVGTVLAKVVQPTHLKAEIKVPETQVKDVALNQPAEIDTRNGIVKGRVSRIEPNAINGTVTVDVRLEGALPPGARPDLSVDGTIELERLADVLYVGRPVFGQQNAVVTLFKIDPDGKEANRVQVKFGRASVNTIEILEGLRVGEKVILSDMSAWDAQNRLRLN
ncbi:MAG: HlyD family efflux transporter periplasmic adaptor subunit [Acidobacteria bacterium]|nr:HlyD family efflux transporter periplasmic adaptor subunit [Acidobacteriota bacterium]